MTIIGQSVNAVVSTVLWAYLASIAILLGGEFNAVRRAGRARRARDDLERAGRAAAGAMSAGIPSGALLSVATGVRQLPAALGALGET